MATRKQSARRARSEKRLTSARHTQVEPIRANPDAYALMRVAVLGIGRGGGGVEVALQRELAERPETTLIIESTDMISDANRNGGAIRILLSRPDALRELVSCLLGIIEHPEGKKILESIASGDVESAA